MDIKSDSPSIDAWLAFLRAHSRVTARLEIELEAAGGLRMTWYDVLVQLTRAQEKQLRIQELGRRLAMTSSGLSRRISRMESAGLVERQPCPEDGRGVLVVLTASGARRYREVRPVHLRGVRDHFLRHLSDDEAEILQRAFERMIADLDTMS